LLKSGYFKCKSPKAYVGYIRPFT